MKKMIKVAITGNIASGKSEVAKIIASHGFKVFDADKIAHAVLDELKNEIAAAFEGFDVLTDGGIDRKKLGAIVFADNNLRKKLEELVHPRVGEEIERIFAANSKELVIFISVPLLFEAKMNELFDKIIFVFADDDLRKKRLTARDGLSEEQVNARLCAQGEQTEKVKKSDFVIYNNSSFEALEEQVKTVLQEVLRENLPPDCGFEGWLFIKREEYKQNIRKLKEEILRLEVQIKRLNSNTKRKKTQRAIDKLKLTLADFAQSGSIDF